jgi:hypothetical protein
MKRRISRVSILQTSKVIGIVYGLLALPITLVGFVRLMAPSQGTTEVPSGIYLAAPLIYGVICFILSLLACLAYNLVAKFTGGVEFNVDDVNANKL